MRNSTGILELHRHYDNERAARSIWPTGKPARPIGEWEVETCCASVRARLALGHSLERIAALYPHYVAAYQHDRRTRGIAEGRRLLARRARFTAWLAVKAEFYSTSVHARYYRTPEDFVRRCRWANLREVAEAACFEWVSIPTQKALRLALLASPEWAALPWQREAGR